MTDCQAIDPSNKGANVLAYPAIIYNKEKPGSTNIIHSGENHKVRKLQKNVLKEKKIVDIKKKQAYPNSIEMKQQEGKGIKNKCIFFQGKYKHEKKGSGKIALQK